ncbi:hypothetical protein BDD12DRAFT_810891 [Trichophaea hybrida]|nr:hypothetical protein BDD12DRAFT_810891 [Trichophaea hybrida]
MEHSNLLGTKPNCCPRCRVSIDKLGDLIDPSELVPRTSVLLKDKWNEYDAIPNSNNRESRDRQIKLQKCFSDNNAHPTPNVFWDIPFVDLYELHQPDNLHVIHLGIFKHLMEWIEGFLHSYQRPTESDLVWQTIPPYPGFSHPSKPYRQITQLQGKDMRNIGKIIYPALTAALWKPQPRHRHIFHRAIARVRAMACFGLMAQNRAHDQATIKYLSLYLEEFHGYENIFQPFRTTKRTKGLADDRKPQLQKELLE